MHCSRGTVIDVCHRAFDMYTRSTATRYKVLSLCCMRTDDGLCQKRQTAFEAWPVRPVSLWHNGFQLWLRSPHRQFINELLYLPVIWRKLATYGVDCPGPFGTSSSHYAISCTAIPGPSGRVTVYFFVTSCISRIGVSVQARSCQKGYIGRANRSE